MFGLTLWVAGIACGQTLPSSRTGHTNPPSSIIAPRGEQAARARWQPVRAAGSDAQQGVQQAAYSGPESPIRRVQSGAELPRPVTQPKALRPAELDAAQRSDARVDLGAGGYEVPMPGGRGSSGQSVMRRGGTPSAPEVLYGPSDAIDYDALDGQIIYENVPHGVGFGSATACDSMGCCGSIEGCGGGCDGGCDSITCCAGAGGACEDAYWRPCLTLCFPRSGWFSADYLGWSPRGMRLPPLVTRSQGNVARNQTGVLGLTTTDILFGNENVVDDWMDGGRLQFGFWLDRCQTWGVGAEYFGFGEQTESFSASTTDHARLARPFFNVLTGAEDAELVSFPGVLTGRVGVDVTSELVGAGFHFRRQTNCNTGCGGGLFCGCGTFHSRTDMLFGYRYLQLDESVSVREDLTGLPPDAGRFEIADRFGTRNQFNGVDLGILFNRRQGLWSIDLLAKLAIGNTRQTVDIQGNTLIDGVGTANNGGLLAQQSNMGQYRRDQFTILPELGATIGYQWTQHLRLKAGYTMIFWSNVVRPGDQIDLDINPNFLPPPAVPFGGASRPAFKFVDTDYYVHGLNLGAEYNW